MKVVKIDNITFVHGDNVEWMQEHSYWDYNLSIVDPPYGIAADKLNMGTTAVQRQKQANSGQIKRGAHQKKSWDGEVPKKIYWDELFRVSQRQIVWGANYFIEHLKNTNCVGVWDKQQGADLSFDDFELIWTSFDTKSFIIRRNRAKDAGHAKLHQTQKPVYVYRYLFLNFAKRGMTCLDTHGGSHNIAIAANEFGIHLTVVEKEEEFHLKGIENYRKHCSVGYLEFGDF